jgi:hypothetical protein
MCRDSKQPAEVASHRCSGPSFAMQLRVFRAASSMSGLPRRAYVSLATAATNADVCASNSTSSASTAALSAAELMASICLKDSSVSPREPGSSSTGTRPQSLRAEVGDGSGELATCRKPVLLQPLLSRGGFDSLRCPLQEPVCAGRAKEGPSTVIRIATAALTHAVEHS